MERKIGVLVDNLKLGSIEEAIAASAEMGADGIQVFCRDGAMAPENMDAGGRKAFRRRLSGLGLELSALCGDLSYGFLDADRNREVLPRMKEFLHLALELGTTIVTSHIGTLPEDENAPEWSVGLRAFDDLGSYAEKHGCVIAMETGPEEPALMKRFLDKIDNRGIAVNYDPANLAMRSFDYIGGVYLLKDYIVHTHAKDGVCLLGPASAGGDASRLRRIEAPIGRGSVAFPYYFRALDEIGYEGFVTIEREKGDNRVGDVAASIHYLRELEVWDGVSF